jgi:hypothetical protein
MITRRIEEKCRPEEKSRIEDNRSAAKWGGWPQMFQKEDEIKI